MTIAAIGSVENGVYQGKQSYHKESCFRSPLQCASSSQNLARTKARATSSAVFLTGQRGTGHSQPFAKVALPKQRQALDDRLDLRVKCKHRRIQITEQAVAQRRLGFDQTFYLEIIQFRSVDGAKDPEDKLPVKLLCRGLKA